MKRMGRSALVMMALAAVAGCGDDDDFVEPEPTVVEHTFVYQPHAETPDITSIVVRGEFNDWSGDDIAMTQQADGSWAVTVELEPGTYEYKYVFNGPDGWASNMCADPVWGNPPGGPVVPGLTQCAGDFNNAVLVID